MDECFGIGCIQNIWYVFYARCTVRTRLRNWISTEPIQQEEPTGRCGME